MTDLDPIALAWWRKRELTFPKFTRRMTPDDMDMVSGAWARAVQAAHSRTHSASDATAKPSKTGDSGMNKKATP